MSGLHDSSMFVITFWERGCNGSILSKVSLYDSLKGVSNTELPVLGGSTRAGELAGIEVSQRYFKTESRRKPRSSGIQSVQHQASKKNKKKTKNPHMLQIIDPFSIFTV